MAGVGVRREALGTTNVQVDVMRKLILTMLLAATCGSALADWVKIYDNGDDTVYVNPVSIRKSGNTVKIWVMHDLKKANHVGNDPEFLSLKQQMDFDCDKQTLYQIAIAAYSGNMGSGDIIKSAFQNAKWEPVASNTVEELQMEFACGKK